MTSNIGTKSLGKDSFGFYRNKPIEDQGKIEKNILQSVKNIFSPELLNRLDEVIVFNSLTKEDIYKIIDMQLDDLYSNLLELGDKY